MDEIIQQHIDAVENLQADLEEKIRAALGNLSPEEILQRVDVLPSDIAQELKDWIESNLMPQLIEESVSFLEDIDDEDVEAIRADESRVRSAGLLLLDTFIQTVTILGTAAFAEIRNQAELQQALGRSQETIIRELAERQAGIGARLQAFENQLITATDGFINSAAGIVALQRSSGELTWITVHDRKVCGDCAPRHGTSASVSEWVEQGLPRTGWSVCGQRCRCILISTASFDKGGKPGPVQRGRR